ncbi:hypothetical protein B296_00004401 [Ensete ventricosum]|uniref:Myb-like domain-containing protein n=1 Tax=Ensete ventricosum TaxID=4639 RepID=A0A427B856_ENSVE|nr:hypothetical protein B296_00004401 [Ensete ventricosum]
MGLSHSRAPLDSSVTHTAGILLIMERLEKENNPISVASSAKPPAKKDRHIVTWTSQEDDLLREHIALHGTDKWYTYLNSECKKANVQAQKIFGNRWTEIAKVVSGRYITPTSTFNDDTSSVME